MAAPGASINPSPDPLLTGRNCPSAGAKTAPLMQRNQPLRSSNVPAFLCLVFWPELTPEPC